MSTLTGACSVNINKFSLLNTFLSSLWYFTTGSLILFLTSFWFYFTTFHQHYNGKILVSTEREHRMTQIKPEKKPWVSAKVIKHLFPKLTSIFLVFLQFFAVIDINTFCVSSQSLVLMTLTHDTIVWCLMSGAWPPDSLCPIQL